MAFRCILEYGGANEAKTTLHAFSRKNTSALGKTITDELTATLSESLWTANQ
jgi:hypothetical protein